MNIEDKLKKLGVTLPSAAKPVAAYIPARKVGNLIFVSGQGPLVNNKPVFTGKIGEERTIEEGQEAAKICAINTLAAAATVINLDKIKSVVKVHSFVNGSSGFTKQHIVTDGASNFFSELFGEKGLHPRTAVGVYDLPLDISIEIEAIFEIEE
jgi:enamine deaminase RidA (YjgF/YER057c/UK114 family)